jgi:catechol 2,3-dioxygenase-like lactoylglutathione lyase family enzyme
MIKQIKFISIPVADQNRALDFYTEKLGFTIITDQPFDETAALDRISVPRGGDACRANSPPKAKKNGSER